MRFRRPKLTCPYPGCSFKTRTDRDGLSYRLETHIIIGHAGWTITTAVGDRVCIPCELAAWGFCPVHCPAEPKSYGLPQSRLLPYEPRAASPYARLTAVEFARVRAKYGTPQAAWETWRSGQQWPTG